MSLPSPMIGRRTTEEWAPEAGEYFAGKTHENWQRRELALPRDRVRVHNIPEQSSPLRENLPGSWQGHL